MVVLRLRVGGISASMGPMLVPTRLRDVQTT